MALYETICILDSLLPPEDIEKIVSKIKELIDGNGGKTLNIDRWGKRRLAYEIERKQYGYYLLVEFESDGKVPSALAADYNFNDKVLRYLTYRYDKNKLKAREKEQKMLKTGTAKSQPKPEISTEHKGSSKIENAASKPVENMEEKSDV